MRILLMYEPSRNHLAALHKAAPGARFDIARSESSAKELIGCANAVLGNQYFIQSLPYANKLEWMQSNSAGMDLILNSPWAQKPFRLTSARGVYDEEIAEHTLALMFSLARGIPFFCNAQKQQIWKRIPLKKIASSRCLILGYGSVGKTIGAKLLALGAQVVGVGKTTPSIWRDELIKTDFLIDALPLTPQTTGFVDRALLEKLPPSAYFINIGRGQTVNEIDLLHQIKTGALSGAALDVFAQEPLCSSHPFWKEERIFITPHNARSPENAPYLWEPLFEENMRRFYLNHPLLNLVDKKAGY